MRKITFDINQRPIREGDILKLDDGEFYVSQKVEGGYIGLINQKLEKINPQNYILLDPLTDDDLRLFDPAKRLDYLRQIKSE